MATQRDLEKIWAATGSAIDPSAAKYSVGWTVEKPAYQSFNYVLQNLSNNLLAYAEESAFNWQSDINYREGAQVISFDGSIYTATADNVGNAPVAGNASWSLGRVIGLAGSGYTNSQGLMINNVYNNSSATNWNGNDLTIFNQNPAIYLQSSGVGDNLLFGNIQGSLAVYNAGNAALPTGAINALASANTFRIYHEGFKPVQTDIDNTIPANANDGVVYGRFNATWTPVVAQSSNASGTQVDAGTSTILWVTPQSLTDSGYSGTKADFDDVNAGVNDSKYMTSASLAGSDYIKKSEIIDFIYPIGRIFESTSPTNPAIAYGGVWTAIGAGRVTVGIDLNDSLFNTVGAIGGSKNTPIVTHSHGASVSDPGHSHYQTGKNSSGSDALDVAGGGFINNRTSSTSVTGISVSIANANGGTSGTNKNLQPYMVVYRWERTA